MTVWTFLMDENHSALRLLRAKTRFFLKFKIVVPQGYQEPISKFEEIA